MRALAFCPFPKTFHDGQEILYTGSKSYLTLKNVKSKRKGEKILLGLLPNPNLHGL